MKISHDRFGNLRRTSWMTTEDYGKSNIKRRSYKKLTEFVDFLEVSRKRKLYVRYLLILRIHVKIKITK